MYLIDIQIENSALKWEGWEEDTYIVSSMAVYSIEFPTKEILERAKKAAMKRWYGEEIVPEKYVAHTWISEISQLEDFVKEVKA